MNRSRLNTLITALKDCKFEIQDLLAEMGDMPYKEVQHLSSQMGNLAHNNIDRHINDLALICDNLFPVLIKEADPELERLLAEEDHIEAETRGLPLSNGHNKEFCQICSKE